MKSPFLKYMMMAGVSLIIGVIAWFNISTVKEDRMVEKYDAISVSGPIQVFLVKGLGNIVRLEADSDLPPFISTHVVKGKLIIEPTKQISHERVLKVYASSEWIRKIYLSGACTLDVVDKIQVDTLTMKLNGSAEGRILVDCNFLSAHMDGAANIFMAGVANNLDMELSGFSDIVAYNLASKNCSLKINAPRQSPGIFRVSVSDTLRVSMTGSSGRAVYYKGDPVVIKSIVGEGSVTKK